MLRSYPLLAVLFAASALNAATYYVAPDGNDSAAGTINQPWATLHHAAQTLQAGDTAYIREGLWEPTTQVTMANDGGDEAWITFAAYPGEEPVFDFENYPLGQGESHDLGAITVQDRQYIRLDGLTVLNSYRMGINVRDSDYVEVLNCRVDNTFSPGIGVWNSAYVDVIGNTVTRANNPARRTYGDFEREAPHEAISYGGGTHFEVAYNHVYNCYKEGIDIKEVSANGVVHHNYVHDVPRQGLYADAWFGLLHDVEFHHNVVHDCEWGIVVSAEGNATSWADEGEIDGISIHHNVFYDNRASGLYFGLWGGNNYRQNIHIFNNTFYNNGSPSHWSGPTGNIDLRSDNSENVFVYNNICMAGGAFEIAGFDNPNENGTDEYDAKNVMIANNLCETTIHSINRSYPDGYGNNFSWTGDDAIIDEAGFTDLAARIFLLSDGSPAIGAGLSPSSNPQASPDIGAFYAGIEDEPLPQFQVRFIEHDVVEFTLQALPWMGYDLARSSDLETWEDEGELSHSWIRFRHLVPLNALGGAFMSYGTHPLGDLD